MRTFAHSTAYVEGGSVLVNAKEKQSGDVNGTLSQFNKNRAPYKQAKRSSNKLKFANAGDNPSDLSVSEATVGAPSERASTSRHAASLSLKSGSKPQVRKKFKKQHIRIT